MFWKNLPHWLKGGFLMLLIMGIINIPLLVLSVRGACTDESGALTSTCDFLLVVGFTPSVFASYFFSGLENYFFYIAPAFYFLFGAIIGLIIGTFKNDRKRTAEMLQRLRNES